MTDTTVRRTFSQEVKEEVAIHLDEATFLDMCAFLAGFMRQNGSLTFSYGQMGVDIQIGNAVVARKLYQVIRKFFPQIQIEISVRKMVKLKKQALYILKIKDSSKEFYWQTYFMNNEGFITSIPLEYCQNDRYLTYYVQGLFLSSGSINNLHLSSYHLEIALSNEEHARDIQTTLLRHDIQLKIVKRRKQFVLYIKDSTMIGDFLAFLRATNARFAFEDIRITRDMMNSMNRLINCEVANEQKSQKAANKQVDNILYIIDKLGMEKFSEKELLVVDARLQFLDVSLVELSEVLYEQHNLQISKSGLNHVFRKFAKEADELRKNALLLEEE